MFAEHSVGAQRAAPAPARHSLCPKSTLYSAGINRNNFLSLSTPSRNVSFSASRNVEFGPAGGAVAEWLLRRAGPRLLLMPQAEATGLAPRQAADRHDPLASLSDGFVFVNSAISVCCARSCGPASARQVETSWNKTLDSRLNRSPIPRHHSSANRSNISLTL